MLRLLRRTSLTLWIFIALVLGIVLGVAAPGFAKHLAPISDIFLRLIKSIVGPLLFGTLVYGIASAGELKTMGRIALKAVVYFEAATTIALFIGLAVANLVRPGAGISLVPEAGAVPQLAKPVSLTAVLEHAIPSNIFEALAQGDVLQMVVFFFLFGAACSAIGPRAQPVIAFAASVSEVMFRFTKYVMYLAPFGVGAAIAVTVGTKGIGVLFGLGKLRWKLVRRGGVVCGLGSRDRVEDSPCSLEAVLSGRSRTVPDRFTRPPPVNLHCPSRWRTWSAWVSQSISLVSF